MSNKKEVGIGMIGAGFLAETRARCYALVSGVPSRLVAVAARTADNAAKYAERHDVPKWFADYEELLSLPEVDVVDLCVPNVLHRRITEVAAAAGKHVICTKPLTAYVGQDLGEDVEEEAVSQQEPSRMLEVASVDAQAMVDACESNGVQLMYGENWIYAPSLSKATSLIKASKGTILEMRGGECHNGSHSPFSKRWKFTGGGALLRMGSHPIGAMLYLKHQEGLARNGVPIRAVAVSAEVGDLSSIESVEREVTDWMVCDWVDVENWGTAILTFSDGSRAVVNASDTVLGGMESRLEVYMSNSHLKLNMSPNNLLQAYAPDDKVFGEEYIMEKVSTSAGWTTPIPEEDWTSGHLAMCQDFVEAAATNRPARSDGRLGVDVIKVIYSAYIAAAEGRRVNIE
jgi:predicted dehydrogenase